MYRNPAHVRKLAEQIRDLENALKELRVEWHLETRLVPLGYRLLEPGDIVAENAIAFEPTSRAWMGVGNSAGKVLNAQGYVDHLTYRGWLYANPEEESEDERH